MLSPGIINLSKELWFFLMEKGVWNLGSRPQGCPLLLDISAPGPLSGQSSRDMFRIFIRLSIYLSIYLSVCLSIYTHTRVCACVLGHSGVSDCDPMDCSPPVSSVFGIVQATILEWVAISSSRGSSQPRD